MGAKVGLHGIWQSYLAVCVQRKSTGRRNLTIVAPHFTGERLHTQQNIEETCCCSLDYGGHLRTVAEEWQALVCSVPAVAHPGIKNQFRVRQADERASAVYEVCD